MGLKNSARHKKHHEPNKKNRTHHRANKGIGLETARQLARDHGFTVLIGARDEARGTQAADELKAAGLDAQFLLLDPTDAASVERARAQVEQKFGSLDVLVNNAGKFDKADLVSPEQVPYTALHETFDLNVFAVHRVTQAFWPLLEKSDAARLVNVSSAIGSLALNADFNGPMKDMNLMAYAASKAALNMMTLHFAKKWKDTPHRANVIHPGSVQTDLNTSGDLSVEEGAKSSVEMVVIGNEGPNGTFSHLGQPLPW